MSIIEQIWNGRCYPAEAIQPRSELYQERKVRCFDAASALEDKLTGEQQDLLTKFLDAQAGTADLVYYEYFYRGMLMGVQLYRELLGLDIQSDPSD